MSPAAPTFGTLNNQLNKAHQRIRELEAREAELLAQKTEPYAPSSPCCGSSPPSHTSEMAVENTSATTTFRDIEHGN